MSGRSADSPPSSPTVPQGHGFPPQGPGPVPKSSGRLLTAYRWTLRSDYDEAIKRAADASGEYQRALQSLLRKFPQGEGEVPQRPESGDMECLFKKVLHREQKPPRGRGSKGGVKHWSCEWPRCEFTGPMQKCMDHFFANHVKLKFFQCDQLPCAIAFTRKYDLDKHKEKQHSISRPRQRRRVESAPTEVSRQTRAGTSVRQQPYSTQDRPTRARRTRD